MAFFNNPLKQPCRNRCSIQRQDSGIIMVGEIRDGETAEIALKASQTGHLVLSTLHTNDSIATMTRLLDLGVAPFLVATSVTGVEVETRAEVRYGLAGDGIGVGFLEISPESQRAIEEELHIAGLHITPEP